MCRLSLESQRIKTPRSSSGSSVSSSMTTKQPMLKLYELYWVEHILVANETAVLQDLLNWKTDLQPQIRWTWLWKFHLIPADFWKYRKPDRQWTAVDVMTLSVSSQVKSSQIYLYSTFHVHNNSKCFTLQQGAEKALKICKIIERNNLNELKLIKTSNSLDK